jgi:Flp pilus assembly pilin Flp
VIGQQHARSFFNPMLHLLVQLRDENSGQDIIEYALITASVGLLTIAGIHTLAASLYDDLNIVVNAFNRATGAGG